VGVLPKNDLRRPIVTTRLSSLHEWWQESRWLRGDLRLVFRPFLDHRGVVIVALRYRNSQRNSALGRPDVEQIEDTEDRSTSGSDSIVHEPILRRAPLIFT
jgi:hypothetical protein